MEERDMYYYQMYGLKVMSDFEFYEADPIPIPDTVDLKICEGIPDQQFDEIINVEEEGEADYYYMCHDQKAIVRKSEIGVFLIENGNLIQYRLTDGCLRESAKQLLLFICIFIVRAQANQIFIHGSCVQVGNTSIIISGKSGAGKSTITTELLLNGAQFMSDDMCPVVFQEGVPYVQSAIPERKLCYDTLVHYGYDVLKLNKVINKRKEKYIARECINYSNAPAPLSAMIIINPVEEGKLCSREIKGNEKLKCVLGNLFYTNIYQKIGNTKAMFQQCVKLSQNVSMYCVDRPMNKETKHDMSVLIQSIISEQMKDKKTVLDA